MPTDDQIDAAKLLEAAMAAYDRGDYAVALDILRPLAERGNARAQGHLGIMHGLGQGVPQDYGQAWDWLTLGADQGDPNSEYNLGTLYDKGWGVRRDHAEAAKWFRRAADQNVALSQYNLGVYCEFGLAMPQDYMRAYMWHHIAATTAFEDDVRAMAVRERRLMAAKLTKAEIARARRWARSWLAEKEAWAPEAEQPAVELHSELTCPQCGHRKVEEMATDACLYYYRCEGCAALLRPRPGDCCVFCSFGSVPCPPVQAERRRSCC